MKKVEEERYERVLSLIRERHFFSDEGRAEYLPVIRELLAQHGDSEEQIEKQLSEVSWENWHFFLKMNGKI